MKIRNHAAPVNFACYRLSMAFLAVLFVGFQAGAVPVNDNFANRIVVTAPAPWTVNGTNNGASRESGEPLIVGNAGGHSVWWSWTNSFNGQVTVTTTNRPRPLIHRPAAKQSRRTHTPSRDHAPSPSLGAARTASTTWQEIRSTTRRRMPHGIIRLPTRSHRRSVS